LRIARECLSLHSRCVFALTLSPGTTRRSARDVTCPSAFARSYPRSSPPHRGRRDS
jgi:hypothetical protein